MTLTTARETATNVRNLTPHINLVHFPIAGYPLDPEMTAFTFVNDNLRHIVNRRMKWSDVAGFVNKALVALQTSISGKRINSETERCTDELFNMVRVAANRRWSWNTAQSYLTNGTQDLIEACLRLL